MSYLVSCNLCKGSGNFYAKSGKQFHCRACNGTGINPNLYQTDCKRCFRSIIYKRDQQAPQFCKECRNIQLEKRCSEFGCNNTIRYKVGWDNVADYCKRCETKRKEGWKPSYCLGTAYTVCGKLIWSPPGKTFTLCQECNEKERAKKVSQWKSTQCKECNAPFSYHIDWDRVPDLCKTCRQRKASERKPKSGEGEHGYAYKKARKEFMRRSLDDPSVGSRIKDWIRQEMKNRGESGYWRSPPGFDVGHIIPGLDDPDNFRWENVDMNRGRGGKHNR